MRADDRSTKISSRQRRVLRAILPVGVGLLVLWVAYVAVGIAGGMPSLNLGSALLGLVTSVILIVFGVTVRRQLPPA